MKIITAKIWKLAFVVTALVYNLFLGGCAPQGIKLKYTPVHDQTYPAKTAIHDVQVVPLEDARAPKLKKQTKWDRSAQSLAADILVDQLVFCKCFKRVSIVSNTAVEAGPGDHDIRINVRVIKLQLFEDISSGKLVGAAALGVLMIPGVIIAGSLPETYVADAEVEFEATDMKTRRVILKKTYAAKGTLRHSEFGALDPVMHLASKVYEDAVKQFVLDLLKTT